MAKATCALQHWTDEIELLTGLERARDIAKPYTLLIKTLQAEGIAMGIQMSERFH